MGLEGTTNLPIEPQVREKYKCEIEIRKKAIEAARKAVKDTSEEIDALQNTLIFTSDINEIESSIANLTTHIT